ncbi:hypothetical protein G5I_12490 [Acromyrmex echinatior]|uniref:DUF5641 domain-containing protein n=1 Tax=Acromyrmex echinatior TaxID=103372 RepID=F4X2G4_ACREC|nr:hypothetical protein G5I_12490 [Acromyrmex echinatior]
MVQTKFAGFREIYLMVTLNLTLRSTLGITQGQSIVLQINSSASVAVGDVVLIENNLQKRLDWPLAVIREVYPGKDGYVRVVKLKTSKGELVRPIQKLIPLEVEHSSPEADNFIESTTTTSETTKGKAANTLEESVAVPKEEPKSLEETSLKTRRGRIIKKPDRSDLNPFDYYVWSVVERVTNKFRHPNVTSLRIVIETAFVGMDSATLQHACECFRPRIEVVIQANGEYIE